ncbi:hypothetical protein TWF970_009100 [Orbilia oligospora]|uniref:Uncharacterized protein n=1 Tax=Orbilia oligospora TaxID=2813651 RepID=A0A7C8VA70_ORBOL|nr:hypothetical protein TWF970_009100 [Orbilia oligospora]
MRTPYCRFFEIYYPLDITSGYIGRGIHKAPSHIPNRIQKLSSRATYLIICLPEQIVILDPLRASDIARSLLTGVSFTRTNVQLWAASWAKIQTPANYLRLSDRGVSTSRRTIGKSQKSQSEPYPGSTSISHPVWGSMRLRDIEIFIGQARSLRK